MQESQAICGSCDVVSHARVCVRARVLVYCRKVPILHDFLLVVRGLKRSLTSNP